MGFPITYRHPCIIQDPTVANVIVVVGVNEDSADNTLEATRVDISDVTNPKFSEPVKTNRSFTWQAASERACAFYPNTNWISNVPTFFMFQLQGRILTADILVNGTVRDHRELDNTSEYSNKLFSYTGNYNDNLYVTAHGGSTSVYRSSWESIVWEGNTPWSDYALRTFPPEDAEISVGTYAFGNRLPVQGYLTVFNATGSKGWSFPITSLELSKRTNSSIQALSAPNSVDMSGIVLTTHALPVTMGNTGYIVDKGRDDCQATVLYSISPSVPKLTPVTVHGNVPPFMPGRVSTVMDKYKLVLFGGFQDNKLTKVIHVFDTESGTWSGPNLVQPCQPPPLITKESNNVGAIAGGVAAGAVVLALALFFVFRRYRRQNRHVVVLAQDTDMDALKGNCSNMNSPPPPSPQPELQDWNNVPKHASIMYQPPIVYTMPDHEPYGQPMIFQPQPQQELADPSVRYSTTSSSSSPDGLLQPHTPYTPLTDCESPLSTVVSVTYADRGSGISPASARSVPSTTTTSQRNGPQYIPT